MKRSPTLRSYYRIAAHFRLFKIDEVLRRPYNDPSVRQLRRWLDYELMDPFGESRADWRAALVTAMTHNVAVKPDAQKATKEFLLKFGPATGRGKQTVAEQVLILNAMAAAFSGG